MRSSPRSSRITGYKVPARPVHQGGTGSATSMKLVGLFTSTAKLSDTLKGPNSSGKTYITFTTMVITGLHEL